MLVVFRRAHEGIPPPGRRSLKILVGEVDQVTIDVVELAGRTCWLVLAVACIASGIAAAEAQPMVAAVGFHSLVVLHGSHAALSIDEGDSSLGPVNGASAGGSDGGLKWRGGAGGHGRGSGRGAIRARRLRGMCAHQVGQVQQWLKCSEVRVCKRGQGCWCGSARAEA
eukprot:707503-Rhodomonas_salina.1